MKLSDNFIDSGDNAVLNLELQVPVLNINSSKHPAVLEHCRALAEYSLFVERVRRYSGADPENGFMTAIQECIEAGILKNYLERKASEVINMLLAEYSYETDLKVQREEARQEGLEQGLSQGLSQGLERKARETARKLREMGLTVDQIIEATGLSEEEIGHINKNG